MYNNVLEGDFGHSSLWSRMQVLPLDQHGLISCYCSLVQVFLLSSNKLLKLAELQSRKTRTLQNKKVRGSPYLITECRVPELAVSLHVHANHMVNEPPYIAAYLTTNNHGECEEWSMLPKYHPEHPAS